MCAVAPCMPAARTGTTCEPITDTLASSSPISVSRSARALACLVHHPSTSAATGSACTTSTGTRLERSTLCETLVSGECCRDPITIRSACSSSAAGRISSAGRAEAQVAGHGLVGRQRGHRVAELVLEPARLGLRREPGAGGQRLGQGR